MQIETYSAGIEKTLDCACHIACQDDLVGHFGVLTHSCSSAQIDSPTVLLHNRTYLPQNIDIPSAHCD